MTGPEPSGDGRGTGTGRPWRPFRRMGGRHVTGRIGAPDPLTWLTSASAAATEAPAGDRCSQCGAERVVTPSRGRHVAPEEPPAGPDPALWLATAPEPVPFDAPFAVPSAVPSAVPLAPSPADPPAGPDPSVWLVPPTAAAIPEQRVPGTDVSGSTPV